MSKRLIAPLAAAALAMGAAGTALIKEHEGLRYAAYLDPVGIPTICYGHTGPEVRLGLRYTQAQCDALLAKDIRVHRAGLAKCVTRPLNANQWDGLTSFAFNIGIGGTCKSTLVRKVNAGDFAGAAAEFPKWKYATANGKKVVLPGLIKRRASERTLFSAPVEYEAVSTNVRYSFLVQPSDVH